MPNPNPCKVQSLATIITIMKNFFYLILTLAAFALAIAVSNGKLGGISDAEAFRRASLTRP